jgi:membrane protein
MARASAARARAGRASGARRLLGRSKDIAREISGTFRAHGLATYTSAIAFRALVALVPLTLLALGLLGALGLQGVWNDTVAPAIARHVTPEVYSGIDASVQNILTSSTAGLIAFASLLALWHLTVAVSGVAAALNRIHDVEDDRPWSRRALLYLGLALATALGLVGTLLFMTAAPRAGGGVVHVVLGLGRWVVAVLALVVVVGLLMRYAPAQHPQVGWASAGSLAVVGCWIVASLGFRWWVSSVANFKTATGSLTVFLVLTAYLFVSVAIFIAGAQLDELLRREAGAA